MQKSLFYFFICLSWSSFLFPCLKNISGLFEVFALSGYLSLQANSFWALQVSRESESPLFTKLFLRVQVIKYVGSFDYAFSYWVFSGLFKHFILSKFITQISADFPSRSAQKMQKHLQIVSGPAYETKSEYFVKYEHIPTLTVPHRAFYSGRMNIPFMPLWTCSDLLKNHTQIFLQCLPHTHIHTQHMCICLLYNADRQLGLMSLTKWSSVNMFQKDLVSLLKHRGSLVAKWSHVYPEMFFFLLLSMCTGSAEK